MVAVLDHVGCERAALVVLSAAIPLLVATHPERISALVLVNATPGMLAGDDYPFGLAREEIEERQAALRADWGTEASALQSAPTMAGDHRFLSWAARAQRLMCTGNVIAARFGSVLSTDARSVLPAIHVPTLVLHREYGRRPRGTGQYLADHIEGAKFRALPDGELLFFLGETAEMLDAIEEFLTGRLPPGDIDRALATVLFTDVVGSTGSAVRLGDRGWRNVLDAHDAMVRAQLERFRGREVNTTGDGFLGAFDSPARSIQCGAAIRDAARHLGVEVRVGIHTGEVELRGQDIGGIAVHIGQRVSNHARPGEVLVSRTVADLLAGSGIVFTDRGEHELKGIPEKWRLFAVEP
jgi:class 3 adenylate cyclase